MAKISHGAIWHAIDKLAKSKGMSPSGLARKAGLDATSFNPSKRISSNGRNHWPSTESISRVLSVTGTNMGEFSKLVSGGSAHSFSVPLIGFAEAGKDGYFDDSGHPTGGSWDSINLEDGSLYALEISGSSMEPNYMKGDTIVVSPTEQVRRNDKVVVKTTKDEVMFKILARQNSNKVLLKSLNPRFKDQEIPKEQIQWIHRVIWASQ